MRYGYLIRCDEVVKDPATGEITELRCTYDPLSLGGGRPTDGKSRGLSTGCRPGMRYRRR